MNGYADAQWMDRGVIDNIMDINRQIDEKRNGDMDKKAREELTKLYNRQLMKSLQLQCLQNMGWNNNITR